VRDSGRSGPIQPGQEHLLHEKQGGSRDRRALSDVDFPADKTDLVRSAEQAGADDETVRALKGGSARHLCELQGAAACRSATARPIPL
jgi:hypothetical protein